MFEYCSHNDAVFAAIVNDRSQVEGGWFASIMRWTSHYLSSFNPMPKYITMFDMLVLKYGEQTI